VDGKGRDDNKKPRSTEPTRATMRRAISLSVLYILTMGVMLAAYGLVPTA
jgi:hypothetical protein